MRREAYPKNRRIFTALLLLALLGLALVFTALLLMGAAPGVMLGVPSTPLMPGAQVFYGYACPAPSTMMVWLSEPIWRADFIIHLCNFIAWGHE